MRMTVLLPALAVLVLSTAPAFAQDRKPADPPRSPQASNPKVAELQKERIATFKALAEIKAKLFQKGVTSPESVLEAKVDLIEAELEAAAKDADRIALCKKLVETLKEHEAIAEAKKNAARDTEAGILKVKAKRLEAEIRLARMNQPTAGIGPPVQRRVTVTRPKVQDVDVTIKYACQILAQRHIEIRLLQSGQLDRVAIKEGQAVKKGELLFNVVPTLQKAKLEVELANVQLAELEARNAEKLFNKQVVSAEELKKCQTILNGAKAKAKLAQTELDFTMIRAPFDGVVGRLQQQEGSLVSERNVLTTLSDNGTMWVYFNVPQAHVIEYGVNSEKRLKENIELVLEGGHAYKHGGKHREIHAIINKSSAVPFRADFPNPDRLLRHGMTGFVRVHRTLKNAIVIPRLAVFEPGKKLTVVVVVDRENVARRREVVVQSEVGDNLVVESGLKPDEMIVADGDIGMQLRAGEKVEFEFRPPDVEKQ